MEIVTKNLGIKGLSEHDVYTWEEIIDYIYTLEVTVDELEYDNKELKDELDSIYAGQAEEQLIDY